MPRRWAWFHAAAVGAVAAASLSAVGSGPASGEAGVEAREVRKQVLIAAGARWRIRSPKRRPDDAWNQLGFPGRTWRIGTSQIGFGEGDEATTVPRRRVTHYFRKSFRVADAPVTRLRLRALVDDGAAFYVNGVPVARKRLAADAGHRTWAPGRVNRAAERRWSSFSLPLDVVRAGRNVLAVEVHNAGDRDLSFDAALRMWTATPSADPTPTPAPRQRPAPERVETMCRIADPRLPEISGMASSVNFPGILWVHNDKGDSARIFAVDANTCAVRAVVALAGVAARDFEAISIGRNPAGAPEIWVGDVGDNDRARPNVTLHRFAEPTVLGTRSVRPTAVTVTWSDGPRNCEALIVEPVVDGRVFLVSKEGRSGIYRLRGDFRDTGAATTGTRIASTRANATDAATAPDRSRTVIRFGNDGTVLTGLPGSAPRSFTFPAQPQGEAVTFSRDGRHLYIASEGRHDLTRIPVSTLP